MNLFGELKPNIRHDLPRILESTKIKRIPQETTAKFPQSYPPLPIPHQKTVPAFLQFQYINILNEPFSHSPASSGPHLDSLRAVVATIDRGRRSRRSSHPRHRPPGRSHLSGPASRIPSHRLLKGQNRIAVALHRQGQEGPTLEERDAGNGRSPAIRQEKSGRFLSRKDHPRGGIQRGHAGSAAGRSLRRSADDGAGAGRPAGQPQGGLRKEGEQDQE